MGCNCRGKKNLNDPRTIPVKALVQNFSSEPLPLYGPATKIAYGQHKDGDELMMWKIDTLAAPAIFQVLAEGRNAYTDTRPANRRR